MRQSRKPVRNTLSAEAVTAQDLPHRLASAPVIVPATSQLPEGGRRGGHDIVAHGYDGDAANPDIFIRDPSSWGQDHDRVQLSRLSASYTGRCITFAPRIRCENGWTGPEIVSR